MVIRKTQVLANTDAEERNRIVNKGASTGHAAADGSDG